MVFTRTPIFEDVTGIIYRNERNQPTQILPRPVRDKSPDRYRSSRDRGRSGAHHEITVANSVWLALHVFCGKWFFKINVMGWLVARWIGGPHRKEKRPLEFEWASNNSVVEYRFSEGSPRRDFVTRSTGCRAAVHGYACRSPQTPRW